ncbi:MAG: hypothetical protein AVDCRST_MAG71-3023 [uncultured Lysobacter sp.]|uniref:Signal transduction histidine kinase dimerisation/phosphoacceptor domain-containing protein n=1 Tax=uncultured Lysobacter sp. TaxID=271060 RepID=A0A6J4MC00_9GAMM|nr:MAG: hypothetical protein AVDCRST_MAG71-3023 [uncultured Lysobacter sp.]
MSSQPPLSQVPVLPPATGAMPAAMHGRWIHELRNELNTAMMAAAAARRLLQDGMTDEALANVRRTEAACYRCASLLRDSDDPL